jgi:hypothetical protein
MMHRFRAALLTTPIEQYPQVNAFHGVAFPRNKTNSVDKMTANTIISVADYYGTAGARELVHRVKNNDVEAIAIMARAMAKVAIEHLPTGNVLIPVPSHTRRATNTLQLSEQISQLTGLPVLDIIEGRKRAPWYKLKQREITIIHLSDDYFDFQLNASTPPPQVPVIFTRCSPLVEQLPPYHGCLVRQ